MYILSYDENRCEEIHTLVFAVGPEEELVIFVNGSRFFSSPAISGNQIKEIRSQIYDAIKSKDQLFELKQAIDLIR